MANRERGELSVTVDGRSYTLRPSFDALCELETLVDQEIDQIIASINKGRLGGIRAVIWTLLQEVHGDEIRTLKHASQWIERAGGTGAVIPWLTEVMEMNSEAVTPAKEATANPPVAQDDGTGDRLSLAPVASV